MNLADGPTLGSSHPSPLDVELRNNGRMRGQLLFIGGGATIAVAALAFSAAAAYASPLPVTSAAVDHVSSLTVPAHHHPAHFAPGNAPASGGGLIAVEPGSAVALPGTGSAPVESTRSQPDPVSTGTPAVTSAPPSGVSVSTSTDKGDDSKTHGSDSNSGNDVKNKGTGSGSSDTNSGNDVKNKGTGSGSKGADGSQHKDSGAGKKGD